MEKSTDDDQNLISFKDGQDTLACQILWPFNVTAIKTQICGSYHKH